MPGSNLANLSNARVRKALADLEGDLLNALAVAVIATDIDGCIIYWNRAAEQLYGWTADEVAGRNILDVTPSAESRAAAAAIFDALTRGESWAGRFETRHKKGHSLLVDVTDSPVRDQQGRLTAIVGVSKLVDAAESLDSATEKPALASRMMKGACAILQTISAERPNLWVGFAIATLLYWLAVSGRLLLDLIIPSQLPFISFFPVVIVSAILCGLWPTLGLLFAASVTGAMWISANSDVGIQIFTAALFMLAGGVVVAPVIYASSAHRRLQRRDEQLNLINRELKHRLKNLFAVTSSICTQTVKSSLPREELSKVISARIKAIASAQELLSATGEEGSDLRTLIEAVVRPLSPDATRLDIRGPQVSLPAEATMAFGLVLHELATNALKYGAWAGEEGRTIIEWRVPQARQLMFRWREDALISSESKSEGFGTVVIKRALNQAKVKYDIGPRGADCQIELPL